MRENLTRRALRFNLVLDDVSITHVAFSPEFTHAVEAKQVRHLSFSGITCHLTHARWLNKPRSEQPSWLTKPSRRSRFVTYLLHTRWPAETRAVHYREGTG